MARRRATLKDVAHAVGVHVSTVSRALNPETRHFIRPEVAERILAASAALQYRPNAAAYSLRTSRTRIVGVLIPDIANPVFPPIIRGIEDVLHEHGYMAILVNTDARRERQDTLIGALNARGIDGLIVASLERSAAAVRQVMDEGLPVVTVNRRSDDAAIPSVVNDEESGIRQLLVHLAGLGHRRIATIAGPQHISTGKARLEAFERYRRSLGLETSAALVTIAEALSESEGERCAGALLALARRPSAILAANDLLAIGAMAVVERGGLACPGDVAVTGFNDMPLVGRMRPALTTVRVQQYEVGRRAAGLLLDRIAGKGGDGVPHEVMPVELVVRASTGPAP